MWRSLKTRNYCLYFCNIEVHSYPPVLASNLFAPLTQMPKSSFLKVVFFNLPLCVSPRLMTILSLCLCLRYILNMCYVLCTVRTVDLCEQFNTSFIQKCLFSCSFILTKLFVSRTVASTTSGANRGCSLRFRNINQF